MKTKRMQWRRWGIAGAGALLTILLASYKVTSSLPGLTLTEQATINQSRTWQGLVANPLNLPYRALLRLVLLGKNTPVHLFLLFLPSMVLALLTVCMMMRLSRRWYGQRSMILGCLLFIAAAWFLHLARFIGTDIEYVCGIIALLFMHVTLHDYEDRPLITYGWLITNLLLLTMPGMVWFVLFSTCIQWRTMRTAWKRLGTVVSRIGWTTLGVVGVGLLAVALVRDTSLVRPWLGVPQAPPTWQSLLHNVGSSFTALVWQAPDNPEVWLGHLPLLDICMSVMLIAGILFYAHHLRAQRTYLLLGYIILGGILAGIGGVPLGILLPVIFLVIVGGIAYTLHFWLRMFPRNPIARGAGIAIFACLIALSCFYNLKQYFVAWPHNPETVTIAQRQ